MRIVQYPHPALGRPTLPVRSIDADLRRQVGRMFELMYDARGLGLAANQVALPLQALVMNMTGNPNDTDAERVYLNPRIVAQKGVMDGDEGCLSFPGMFAPVRRSKQVEIEAYDLEGNVVRVKAAGLEARAWQHELDHLAGVVFIERFAPLVRQARGKDIAGFERSFRAQQEAGVLPADADLAKTLRDLEQALGG
jgi:peptide deformylase